MPHPIRRRLHPLKTANHLFWKQGCPKKGHASAPIGADCTPWKHEKLFFENKNPRFWDCHKW
jgi:hypothetical protein